MRDRPDSRALALALLLAAAPALAQTTGSPPASPPAAEGQPAAAPSTGGDSQPGQATEAAGDAGTAAETGPARFADDQGLWQSIKRDEWLELDAAARADYRTAVLNYYAPLEGPVKETRGITSQNHWNGLLPQLKVDLMFERDLRFESLTQAEIDQIMSAEHEGWATLPEEEKAAKIAERQAVYENMTPLQRLETREAHVKAFLEGNNSYRERLSTSAADRWTALNNEQRYLALAEYLSAGPPAPVQFGRRVSAQRTTLKLLSGPDVLGVNNAPAEGEEGAQDGASPAAAPDAAAQPAAPQGEAPKQ